MLCTRYVQYLGPNALSYLADSEVDTAVGTCSTAERRTEFSNVFLFHCQDVIIVGERIIDDPSTLNPICKSDPLHNLSYLLDAWNFLCRLWDDDISGNSYWLCSHVWLIVVWFKFIVLQRLWIVSDCNFCNSFLIIILKLIRLLRPAIANAEVLSFLFFVSFTKQNNAAIGSAKQK